MKTTVEIADSPLRAARKLAARDGVALQTLIERGLHRVLVETQRGPRFKLRHASFKGHGPVAELRDASWDKLCDLSHEDRGA